MSLISGIRTRYKHSRCMYSTTFMLCERFTEVQRKLKISLKEGISALYCGVKEGISTVNRCMKEGMNIIKNIFYLVIIFL